MLFHHGWISTATGTPQLDKHRRYRHDGSQCRGANAAVRAICGNFFGRTHLILPGIQTAVVVLEAPQAATKSRRIVGMMDRVSGVYPGDSWCLTIIPNAWWLVHKLSSSFTTVGYLVDIGNKERDMIMSVKTHVVCCSWACHVTNDHPVIYSKH